MAKVKIKDGENLTDENIERVLALFNDGKLNKTQACKELEIAYNTKRLDTIFAEYTARIENEKRLYRENSRKPFSDADVSYIVSQLLSGSSSVAEIARDLYRTPAAVKKAIENIGVPVRDPEGTYQRSSWLPEACITDKVYPGQIVWSAQHQCLAIVLREASDECYGVYVLEPIDWSKVDKLYVRVDRSAKYGGFHAILRVSELGSLEHLKIDLYSQIQKDFPKWKIERPKIDS